MMLTNKRRAVIQLVRTRASHGRGPEFHPQCTENERKREHVCASKQTRSHKREDTSLLTSVHNLNIHLHVSWLLQIKTRFLSIQNESSNYIRAMCLKSRLHCLRNFSSRLSIVTHFSWFSFSISLEKLANTFVSI